MFEWLGMPMSQKYRMTIKKINHGVVDTLWVTNGIFEAFASRKIRLAADRNHYFIIIISCLCSIRCNIDVRREVLGFRQYIHAHQVWQKCLRSRGGIAFCVSHFHFSPKRQISSFVKWAVALIRHLEGIPIARYRELSFATDSWTHFN